MMISSKMNSKLNEQVTAELMAAHQYLSMACSFDGMGFKILSKRFIQQYEEELEHAMKFVKYLLEVGGTVQLEALPKPASGFKGVEQIVQAALDGEKHITNLIHGLVALAEDEKDYATRSFLGWFIDEQVEEVSSMVDLLNLIRLAGGNILQVEMRVRHEMTEED